MFILTDFESLKNIKKFAVLGGPFDPIHFGHISVAEEVLEKTDVEKIIFIPAGNPPHKSYADVTTPLDRLKMTALAIEGRKNMEISSIEIDREGTTYTVDTIIELKRMLGDNVNFKFITGADAIHYITTWKNYKKLLEICDFIAVTRPGFNKKILLEEISFMEQNFKSRVEFIEIRPVDISSSQIRQRVAEGMPINGLVPKKVEEYIINKKLYK